MDNRESNLSYFGDDLTFPTKIDGFSSLKENTIDFLASERSTVDEKTDMPVEQHQKEANVDDFLNFHDDIGDTEQPNQFASNNPVLLPTTNAEKGDAKSQPEIDFNAMDDDYLNPYAMNKALNETTNEKFISSEDLLTDFKDPISSDTETKEPASLPKEIPIQPVEVPKEIPIQPPAKKVEEPSVVVVAKPVIPESKARDEPAKSAPSSSSDTQIEAEAIFKSIGLG